MLIANQIRLASRWLAISISMLAVLLLLPEPTPAQEEVASAMRRYKEYEVSTGYYEEYEARPRRQRPLIEIPGVTRGIFPLQPGCCHGALFAPAWLILTGVLNSIGAGAVRTAT